MWAKLDDQWWMHPKVMGLSMGARGLWTTALSYAGARQTPELPEQFVRMVTVAEDDPNQLVGELVDAGLWLPADSGWTIHDWGEYQVTADSEQKASAGRVGGLTRALRAAEERAEQAEKALQEAESKQNPSTGRAPAEQDGQADPQARSRPEPVPEPSPEDHAAEAAADREGDPPDEAQPPDGGEGNAVPVEGFDEPFPLPTKGVQLTGEIVRWAVDAGLAEPEFRTPLQDARLAVDTIAHTIGRRGRAVQAAIAVVGDYVQTIRGEQLNGRTWGMLQAAVSNRGPTAVLDALAESLDRGAGLDGGHEAKGTVAVVEYALAILRGEDAAA